MEKLCLKCFALTCLNGLLITHVELDNNGELLPDAPESPCDGEKIPLNVDDLYLLEKNGFYRRDSVKVGDHRYNDAHYLSLDHECRQIIRDSVEKVGAENWDESMRLPIDEVLKHEEEKREEKARRKEEDERDTKRFSYIATAIIFVIIILMAGCSNRYCSDGHRSSTSAHQQQVQRESAQLYNTWNSMKSGN